MEFSVEIIEPRMASEADTKLVLHHVDKWLKREYATQNLHSKSNLLLTEEIKGKRFEFNIKVLRSDQTKGIIVPLMTKITFKVVPTSPHASFNITQLCFNSKQDRVDFRMKQLCEKSSFAKQINPSRNLFK